MGAYSSKYLKRFYQLYTSDLTFNEIERLIKRDAPGVYDFYLRSMEQPDENQNRFVRILVFVRNLFTAFLLKLTPARRIFYSITLFLFVSGYFTSRWSWAIAGFILLNILIAFELADKLTAKDELEVAREIQAGLLPKKVPFDNGYDIAFFSESAREVGGDYYDFIQPAADDDGAYLVVGDISGKGMAAALHMVQVQAILHHLAKHHGSPRALLVALNENLSALLSADSFFTICVARLNQDGSLLLCRAGHMPVIHFASATQSCCEIVPAGIGIGLRNGNQFGDRLEEISVTPKTNDVLLYYTDGVTETMNGQKQQFGEDKLKSIIIASADKTATGIRDAILTELAQFRGLTPPYDDLTMIVMKAK